MAPKTPRGVPSVLTLGDTWKWAIPDLSDFPNSEGWLLRYTLEGLKVLQIAPNANITLAFQLSGDDANTWLVQVLASAQGDLTGSDGDYRLKGRIVGAGTYAGIEYQLSDTPLFLLPDPRVSSGHTTHASRMVAILENEIEARITGDGSSHNSYQIEGHAMSKMTVAELATLRAKYAALVYQERTGQLGRPVSAVFGRIHRHV